MMLAILEHAINAIHALAVFSAIALFLEAFWPREAPTALVRRLRSIWFNVVSVIAAVTVSAAIALLPISLGFEPLLVVPGLLGLVFAAFMGDFFYYWMHRMQHQVPWLWKYHSVHHSIEEMDSLSGYQHVSQPLLQLFLVSVPTSLFVSPAQAVSISWALGVYGFYIHSRSALNVGPLRAILIDNHLHRIHHSIEPRHYDRNFGVVTSIWDRLFGTAYFPEKDEWPETGLTDRREPRTTLEYLFPSRLTPRPGPQQGDAELDRNGDMPPLAAASPR